METKTTRAVTVEFNDHASLKEKQEYYRYDTHPWRFKNAPELNPELRAAMKRLKLDRAYRFVWGGLVVVREEPNDSTFEIARGSREAGAYFNGVFMPKYLFGRAKQARGYCYYNDLNQKVSGFTREELVPPDKLARVDYRYVDFGRLYWHLEARANAEELVRAGVYNAKDPVPESEWNCVMVLTAKNGLYYEPGLEMIDVLQKREWENQNRNLKDVAREMMQRQQQARLDREQAEAEAEDREFNEVFNDVIKRVEKQTVYLT